MIRGRSGTSIDDVWGIANPARRALAAAGIAVLDDLAHRTDADIRDLHGIGPNGLRALRQALADNVLVFKYDARPNPRR